MARRPLLVVSAILAVALTVLVAIGLRVLARDRAELFARYGQARAQASEASSRWPQRQGFIAATSCTRAG